MCSAIIGDEDEDACRVSFLAECPVECVKMILSIRRFIYTTAIAIIPGLASKVKEGGVFALVSSQMELELLSPKISES